MEAVWSNIDLIVSGKWAALFSNEPKKKNKKNQKLYSF
jgi:hypothetical protein